MPALAILCPGQPVAGGGLRTGILCVPSIGFVHVLSRDTSSLCCRNTVAKTCDWERMRCVSSPLPLQKSGAINLERLNATVRCNPPTTSKEKEILKLINIKLFNWKTTEKLMI